MANDGSGIGRYRGFGLGADSVVDANGNLHAQDGAGGFVAWRHAFNGKLRSNLMYSVAGFDKDRSLVRWGSGVDRDPGIRPSSGSTERTPTRHASPHHSPFPTLAIGAAMGAGEGVRGHDGMEHRNRHQEQDK